MRLRGRFVLSLCCCVELRSHLQLPAGVVSGDRTGQEPHSTVDRLGVYAGKPWHFLGSCQTHNVAPPAIVHLAGPNSAVHLSAALSGAVHRFTFGHKSEAELLMPLDTGQAKDIMFSADISVCSAIFIFCRKRARRHHRNDLSASDIRMMRHFCPSFFKNPHRAIRENGQFPPAFSF